MSLLLMALWQKADETVIITSLNTSIYFYSSTQRIITVIHSSDSSPRWAYASKKFFLPSFNCFVQSSTQCSYARVPTGGAGHKLAQAWPGISPYLPAPCEIKADGNRDGIELHHIQIETLCLSHLFHSLRLR